MTLTLKVIKPERELQCSICLDQFQSPKLLPCRHTFCTKCLRNYKLRTKGADETILTCPLCRSSIYIPPDGIGGFMSNYFVEVPNVKEEVDSNICKTCSTNSFNGTECSHCGVLFCTRCMKQHRREVRRSRRLCRTSFDSDGSDFFVSDSDSSSSSSDSSSSNNPDDVHMSHYLRSSLYPVRTKFIVSLYSRFRINDNIPGYIRKILPTSNGQCWIISTESLDIILCSCYGNELQRIHVGESVNGICRSRERLLLTLPTSRKVASLDNGTISTIVNLDTYQPIDVAAFQDGRFIIVGIDDSGVKEEGRIQIYSSVGDVLADFIKDEMNPHSVSVSQSCGFIYISNLKNNSVDIMMDSGAEIARYRGRRGGRRPRFHFFLGEPEPEERFLPLGSCSSWNDFVIVIDGTSSLLHVLDLNGKFVGPVLSVGEDAVGEPQCIAVDPYGKIWLGDFNNGIIKVFEINSYVNMLGDSSEEDI